MFPKMKSRETLKFERNKIHCSPRGQSLSDLLYTDKTKENIEKRAEIPAVNISRVTVNCYNF